MLKISYIVYSYFYTVSIIDKYSGLVFLRNLYSRIYIYRYTYTRNKIFFLFFLMLFYLFIPLSSCYRAILSFFQRSRKGCFRLIFLKLSKIIEFYYLILDYFKFYITFLSLNDTLRFFYRRYFLNIKEFFGFARNYVSIIYIYNFCY